MRVLRLLSAAAALLLSGALAQSTDDNSNASTSATDEQPTQTTATSTSTGSSTSRASASSSAYPDPDDDPLTRCRQDDIVKFPFCAPKPNDVLRTDGTYYLTWNNDVWPDNSTVVITLNYKNPGGAGPVVDFWESSNARGFVLITPKVEWLYNQTLKDDGEEEKVDYQEVYFTIMNDSPDTPGARGPHTGPVFNITSKPEPKPINTSPNNRPSPSFLGLVVGLPLVAAFILAGVCGTHFLMRNQRRIGPIAIGGGRRHFQKGYTGRKARRQRAHVGGGATYRDEPDDEDAVEEARSAPAPAQRDWELASVRGGREPGIAH